MKKKTLKISLIIFSVLLLFFIGATYSYFAIQIINRDEITTIAGSTGDMIITYEGGPNIVVGQITPSPTPFASKTFTVSGNTTQTTTLNYNLNIVQTDNQFESHILSYKLTSTNTSSNGTIVPPRNMCHLLSGENTEVLGSGTFQGPTGGKKIHTYTLDFYFEKEYGENTNKTFNFYIETKEGNIAASNCKTVIEQTQEGTELVFDGSFNDKLEIELYGKSYQNGTPSPTNILPFSSLNNVGIVSSHAQRNLIIRSTETINHWITIEGNIVSNPNHSISDFISISPSTIYNFSKSPSSIAGDAGYFRWGWYDQNKNYISRVPNASNDFSWTSPSNAYYVRISYPSDCFPKFEKGNKTSWTPAPEDITSGVNASGIYKVSLEFADPMKSADTAVDRVFKDTDGIYKITRNLTQISYTNTTTFNRVLNSNSSWASFYPGGGTIKNNGKVVSNYYPFGGNPATAYLARTGFQINGYGDTSAVFMITDTSITLTQFYNRLVATPLIIIGERPVPVTANLTQTYQNQLNNLPSYSGKTYVYTVSPISPTIKATMKVKN